MIADLGVLVSRIPDPLAFAGAVLVVGFLVTRLAFNQKPVGQFLCQLTSMVGFTAMLAIAGVIPFRPTPAMDLTITYLMISFFKIVWWLAAAWLLAGFVRAVLVFKRQPLETQFLQDLCAGFIYVSAVLGIVAYVFDMPVSGLLAASGVIAIVLGLALQSTLGDVFSGVVLNLSKPYHPGDWVILDHGLAGRIVETNWRATHILTETSDLAVVPNSIIAKSTLVNASMPTAAHGLTVSVRLDPAQSPLRIVAVLETALLSCTEILRTPMATAAIQSLDACALECELAFFVPFIEQAPIARNEVFDRVFRHCVSAGIRLAPPAGSAFTPLPHEPPHDTGDVPRRLLELLPIFAPLSDDERLALAPKMTCRTYKTGDILIAQGVVAPALFILSSGVLAELQQHETGEAEILRLAPGDCFGQASVLTGATTTFKVTALTRVTVYEIAKDDIAPILKNRPAIALELGQILKRREAAGRSRLKDLDRSDEHPGSLAERVADRVKLLLGIP